MARPVLNDRLQAFPFYLLDVGPIEALALPIFTPLFGFSSITAPEIQVETHEVREGNWHYSHKVVKHATVGTMTLARGSTFYDADFWRWIMAAIDGDVERFQSRTYGLATGIAKGDASGGAKTGVAVAGALGGLFGFPRIGGPTYRRNLLLVHTFSRTPTGDAFLSNAIVGATGVAAAAAGDISLGAVANTVTAAMGSVDRLPAKAWMLKGCIPTRYKVGSDFDAMSSEVSIQEIDIEVDFIEEMSLAS